MIDTYCTNLYATFMRNMLLFVGYTINVLFVERFKDKEELCVLLLHKMCSIICRNKGIGDAGSTADIRMLWPWSALVCLCLL